jgi:hypothetical protein
MLKIFSADQDPGSMNLIFLTLDPGWEKIRSGIRNSVFIKYSSRDPVPCYRSSEKSKKRERSASSAKLDIPAAKMARALGTNNPQVSPFLYPLFPDPGSRIPDPKPIFLKTS